VKTQPVREYAKYIKNALKMLAKLTNFATWFSRFARGKRIRQTIECMRDFSRVFVAIRE